MSASPRLPKVKYGQLPRRGKWLCRNRNRPNRRKGRLGCRVHRKNKVQLNRRSGTMGSGAGPEAGLGSWREKP